MDRNFISAAGMKVGMSGVVAEVSDSEHGNRLLEMGCVPGSRISLRFTAPGGEPMAFEVEDAVLAMRKSEAQSLTVLIDGK